MSGLSVGPALVAKGIRWGRHEPARRPELSSHLFLGDEGLDPALTQVRTNESEQYDDARYTGGDDQDYRDDAHLFEPHAGTGSGSLTIPHI